MAWTNATFDNVLDDLSSRFIINVPDEELASVERICFQIEQAHWFYEDFIREQNPALPSFNLKSFSAKFFQHCPLLHEWANEHETAFANFMEYKIRVPVCGAIILNDAMDKCILVKGWTARSGWGFPKGKINKDEPDSSCAVREVWEETGFDATEKIQDEDYVEQTIKDQRIRLYIIKSVPESTVFEPQTRKEISKIEWHFIADLPTSKPKPIEKGTHSGRESGTERSNGIKNPSRYYMVTPFVHKLKNWIITQRRSNKRGPNNKGQHNPLAHLQSQGNDSSTSAGSYQQQQHSSNRHQTGVPNVSATEARLDSDVLKNMLGIGKPTAFSQDLTPVHQQHQQHPAHHSPPLSRNARDSSESLKALLGIQGGVNMLNADGTATGSPTIQSSTAYSNRPISMPSSTTSNSSASVPYQNGSNALKAMLGISAQSNSPLLHPSQLAGQHGGSPLMANAGVAIAHNNNGNRGSHGSTYSPQLQHASAANSPMRARNGPVDLLALLKGGGGDFQNGNGNGNGHYENGAGAGGVHHGPAGNGAGNNSSNDLAPVPVPVVPVTKPKTMQNFTFDMEALF